jgi:hypothetical protein
MTEQKGIELARDFVREEFVDRGMIADLNVHWDIGADGLAKPHAHVMLTMREVGEDGFGKKNRDWNPTDLLEKWREHWSEHVNQRLAELDIDARIDHRSLEAQGIDLEPQHKIGPAASRMAAGGLESERLDEHRAIARANGEKIIANPSLALDAITHNQATFTRRDFAMFAHRHSDGLEQFERVKAAVNASPELARLGRDGRGEWRFTSRDMIETEARLERAADRLAGRSGHGLPAAVHRGIGTAAGSDNLRLGKEQQAALAHITRPADLAIVTGYAGTAARPPGRQARCDVGLARVGAADQYVIPLRHSPPRFRRSLRALQVADAGLKTQRRARLSLGRRRAAATWPEAPGTSRPTDRDTTRISTGRNNISPSAADIRPSPVRCGGSRAGPTGRSPDHSDRSSAGRR